MSGQDERRTGRVERGRRPLAATNRRWIKRAERGLVLGALGATSGSVDDSSPIVVHPSMGRAGVSEGQGAQAQSPGQEAYMRHCTVCHGEQGRGDGPAARAFDPGPPDFTDPDGLGTMTDQELIEVVSRGRRSMPAFEAVLEGVVLSEVVAYLRELSKKGN